VNKLEDAMNKQKFISLITVFWVVILLPLTPGVSTSVSANNGEEKLSSTTGYVTLDAANLLVLVDTIQHTTTGSIDLAQYGCSSPMWARLTPDRVFLWVYCDGSTNILIFETDNNSKIATVDIPNGTGWGDIAFTPDGAYAVVGSSELDQVYVIDTATYTIVHSIPTVKTNNLVAHPYLPIIYLAGSECCYTGFIQVIDMISFTVKTTIPLGVIMWGVQTSPDGQWLYASDYFGQSGIYKIDTRTNTVVGNISGLGELFSVQVTPDGSRLFVTGGWSGSIKVIDATNFTYLTSIDVGGITFGSELTCDGNELYVGNNTNTVPVIDTQNLNIPYQIPMPGLSPNGIAICPQYAQSDFYTQMAVDKMHASPGQRVDYTINIYNYKTEDFDSVMMTDTLPASLTYIDGSLSATSGTPSYDSGVISWTGAVDADQDVTITFGARVGWSATIGETITNAAIINNGVDEYIRVAAVTVVNYHSYLPSIEKSPVGFTGKVTMNGNPAAGVPVDLRLFDGANYLTVATTSTASDGSYVFYNMPPLTSGQAYWARFKNNSNPDQLYLWCTGVNTTYNASHMVTFETFDILNIFLTQPESGSVLTLPVTFQWLPRSATPTDSYEFDIFDYDTGDPSFYTDPPLGHVGSYTLTSLPPGFSYNRWYCWDVVAYSPDGGYGVSYYCYWIGIVRNLSAEEPGAPELQSIPRAWLPDWELPKIAEGR
jgi:uncharacterized repeat protein (TIGR01451 family)